MTEPPAEPADNSRRTQASPDGVDVSLIRWMLSLTPAERLRFLDSRMRDLQAIRELNARR